MPISQPINPLAVHIGSGVIQLYVLPPASGTLRRYEIQCAFAMAGPYQSYSNWFFTDKDAYIYGFAIGRNVYVRIRAIDVDGSVSEWEQAKLGLIQTVEVLAECSCIEGSRIPEGARFVIHKRPDRLVGLVAQQDIEF
jgi:hypothetical protein